MTKKKASSKKPEGYVLGRPTKYKKQFCQMLIDHMSQGFSYETFSTVVKANRSNIYEWEKKHKEFRDAKKIAFDECQMYWEKMGMAGTVGKLKGFSTPMWIVQMKKRFKWADRQEHAVDTEQNEIKLSYNPKD